MKKIILVLIISLGLIACEKEQEVELSFLEVCEYYNNYDIYRGLKTIDFTHTGRGNAELYEVNCDVRLDDMRASFKIIDGVVVNTEATIDGEIVDYEYWRVLVYELYNESI